MSEKGIVDVTRQGAIKEKQPKHRNGHNNNEGAWTYVKNYSFGELPSSLKHKKDKRLNGNRLFPAELRGPGRTAPDQSGQKIIDKYGENCQVPRFL